MGRDSSSSDSLPGPTDVLEVIQVLLPPQVRKIAWLRWFQALTPPLKNSKPFLRFSQVYPLWSSLTLNS